MHFRVPTRVALSALAIALATATTMGCAHSDGAVADRHVAEMRDTINKIEAEQDRENHVGLLDGDEKAGSTKAKPATAPVPGNPAARTVQIGDGDDGRDGDDPNDPNARPEIKLQGQPGSAPRPLRGKSSRGGGRDEARINPSSDETLRTDGPRSSVLDPEAKKAYDAALAQVNAKQYDRGLEALNAFLVRWPDHPYVENAMYWRGEAYYAKGEYLRAAEQLEAVIARFTSGSKSPDALLKIGLCHERLGANDRAKEYWERLKREYPRSDAAKKIPNERSSNDRTNDTRGMVGPKENR